MKTVADENSDDLPAKAPQKPAFADIRGKPTTKESWGFHLLVDMAGVNKNADDKAQIKAYFKEVLKDIDMESISPLIIERAPPGTGRGLSAIQMLATSHMSFHCDDAGRRLFVDIFSCEPFNEKLVEAAIKRRFQPKWFASKFIFRNTGKAK